MKTVQIMMNLYFCLNLKPLLIALIQTPAPAQPGVFAIRFSPFKSQEGQVGTPAMSYLREVLV